MEKPDFTPIIMSYSDDGITLDDFNDFIKACEKFKRYAEHEYYGKKIKLYFLPEEMVNMLSNPQLTV